MNNILTTLMAMLLVAILIVWSYTVPGKYPEKTDLYEQVLDLGVECDEQGGVFDYQDMTCVRR